MQFLQKNTAKKKLQNVDGFLLRDNLNDLQAEASMAPLSQIMRQFLLQVLPSSKNVSSIWSIVLSKFSWKVVPEKIVF